MKKIDYILFDVAGTLLHKPSFYDTFLGVLKSNGYNIAFEEFKKNHKLLSEVFHFPDKTNSEFYKVFNSELLFSLGILPSDKLLDEIFISCSYLPWTKFEDTSVINQLEIPIGIISNFNSTLKDKINEFFGPIFSHILVSEELGISKPDINFYKKAVEFIDLDPKRILYIGDSVKLDIKPALTCDIKSLLIDRNNFYPSCKYKISSLKEIKNYIHD